MLFNEDIDVENISLPQDPIFIVGCPRSGTTLLQSLLATQKNLYSLPETHFFNIIYSSIITDENGNIENSCLHRVFQDIKRMMGLGFPRQVVDRINVKAEAKQLNAKRLFELIVFSFLCEQLDEGDLGKIRWVEKTPAHYCVLERISRLYPAGQFVCIIRNPIPTTQSRRKNIPQEKHFPLEMLARGWNEMISCVESFREKHDNKIYLLRYEDLVKGVEEEMQHLGNFLNLEIDTDKLGKYKTVYHKFVLPWEPWKNARLSNEIVNTNNMRKNEVGRIDILRIQRMTRKNMAKYGYEISFSSIQEIFDIIVRGLSVFDARKFIGKVKGLIGWLVRQV